MPSPNSYSVETLTQTALLVGDNSYLLEQLASQLQAKDITTYTNFAGLPPNTDLDYLVVIDSDNYSLPREITKLLETITPRAFYITSLSRVGELPTGFTHLQFGDVFGNNFCQAPLLQDFLNQAKGQGTLTIPGDGIASYHLLTDLDLLEGIFRAITSPSLASPTYLLGEQEISLLSLAYLIRQSLTRELKLTFQEQEWSDYSLDQKKLDLSRQLFTWHPSTNIQDALKPFISHYQPELEHAPQVVETQAPAIPEPVAPQPAPQPVPKPYKLSRLSDLTTNVTRTKKPPKKKEPNIAFVPLANTKSRKKISFKLPNLKKIFSYSPRPLTIILGGLVFAIALYLSAIIASLTMTYLTLRSFSSLVSSDSLPSASTLKTARIPAIFLEANLVAIRSIPGLQTAPKLSDLTSLVSSYRAGLDALKLANNLSQTSSSLLAYVLGTQDDDIASLINQARLESDELYESLSLLDGSLPSEPYELIPDKYHASYSSIKSDLSLLRKHTLTAKAIFAVSPDLLGVGDRRKYLVLFQNNMELRPTGGFIGSFAILSFENGVLYDMPIYDVYAADGQLKGHVEPPAEIKKYLGEANWYLRDSNWDPDFPTSARRAEWFLGKTLDQDVQGTIALNVYSLASILDAIGPINLVDYDEEITGDNIFERAEYHSEVNFFPGSTQKKEFLSSVADSLFSRLRSLDSSQALPVARALAASIDEKNTLLAIDSETTNHAFSTLGWNGELRTVACPGVANDCYSDYAMLVESNFGVNKANYFLRRTLSLAVTIDKDLAISHRLTANYQNTSTSTSWPAGAYKSYTRLYLPAGAILDSVTVDGKALPESKLSLTVEHDRTVYGFLLEVPVSSTVPVEVSYRLSSKLSKNSPTYSLYWQKQSGTASDPLDIYLNYPLYLEPDLVSPVATLNSQQLEFNLSNVTDRRITVMFK